MMGLTTTTNVTIIYIVPKDIIRKNMHALKLAILLFGIAIYILADNNNYLFLN